MYLFKSKSSDASIFEKIKPTPFPEKIFIMLVIRFLNKFIWIIPFKQNPLITSIIKIFSGKGVGLIFSKMLASEDLDLNKYKISISLN